MIADYEEQVLITGVKSGRHCTICTVPPNSRENLTQQWPLRTHQDTQAQLIAQRDHSIDKTDDKWLHNINNFAWDHHLLNIHQAMGIDILHQLFKGIVMYLIQWVNEILQHIQTTNRKRKYSSLPSIFHARPSEQLDYRFRQVPAFTGLKLFQSFSKVKQWTGVEQKAITRQILPVITPLLLSKAPMVLLFTRAVLDFVTIAQYRTHDEETIRFMDHAINRIDKLKEVFRDIRSAGNNSEGHFNFPKFHVITHYCDFIRLFGAADNTDTSHAEAAHKYLIKDFYARTNKQDNFIYQILHHNSRRIRMQAFEDRLLYQSLNQARNADILEEVKATQPAGNKILSKLGLPYLPGDKTFIKNLKLKPQHWRRAGQVADLLDMPELIDTLATFIINCRKESNQISVPDNELDRRQSDHNWAKALLISLHGSILCWKALGKDSSDPEALEKEYVRCCPNWRGLSPNTWRRDYIWLQEYSDNTVTNSLVLKGKCIGKLRLVFTIVDTEYSTQRIRPIKYSGVLVELLKLRNSGRYHDIHGMIELEKWPEPNERVRTRTLGANRIYKMSSIHRSAHVVPANFEGGTTFLLNNYIDWNQFNELYDDDWMAKGTRMATRMQREYLKKRS